MSSPNSNQTFSSAPQSYSGLGRQSGFTVNSLIGIINNAVGSAKAKLLQIQNNRSSISIGDMFEMQMLMNHLSQLSEMATDVVSASNTAISSMARNIKS